MPQKGEGLGQFSDWQKEGGGVFEDGVDTPMHTMKAEQPLQRMELQKKNTISKKCEKIKAYKK